MIESTTEISSLEGTSPRETASTSAHRVPNTLIADYGREKNASQILIKLGFSPQIFKKKPSNIKFHENPSRGSRAVACPVNTQT